MSDSKNQTFSNHSGANKKLTGLGKLLSRLSLIGLLIAITYLVIWFVPLPEPWSENVIYKQQLLQQAQSPKLVFIGGSNLAYGLDSAMLQAATERPTVNMGWNAGLGLRYMLEEAKPGIQSGDIIIVVPEYGQFYDDNLEGDRHLARIIMTAPSAIRYLSSWAQLSVVLSEMPTNMQSKFEKMIPSSTGKVSKEPLVNEYGDLVYHLNRQSAAKLNHFSIAEKQLNPDIIALLTSFETYTTAQGAQLIFMFPPMASSQFQHSENQAAIQTLYDAVLEIPNLTVVGSPAAYIYDDSYFFDTIYHLNAEGREIRSQQVIDELLPLLSDSE